MRFTGIHIRNFGILADVSLSPTEANSGSAVFLNGSNGRGKTSFQSAIRWCIYGLDGLDELVSKSAVRGSSLGSQIEVKVELNLDIDKNGTIANIKRSQLFEKNSDSRVRRIGQETLSVRTIEPGKLADLLPNPEVWVRKFFPERFMNFFLFDGEMMKNFFDTRVKGAIENAVREIAGVDYFEEIAKKLELAKTAVDKIIAKKSGGEAEKVRQTLSDCRILVLKVSEQLEHDDQALSFLEDELRVGEKRWAGVESAARDAERSSEIRRDLATKGSMLEKVEAEFNELVIKAGSMALLGGVVPVVTREIELAHKNGTLPPPFNPASLTHLLDRGACICGSDLTGDSAGAKEVQTLISNFEKSSLVGKKLDASGRQLDIAKALVQSEFQTLKSKNEQIIQLRDDIEKLKREQDALTVGLDGNSDQSLATLGKRINELNKLIPDLRLTIAEAKKDLNDRLIPAEKNAQNQFDQASSNEDEVKILKTESRLTGELAQAAGAIHAVAIQLVRERLEDSISRKFEVVKSGTYKTTVTDDFDVLTFNEDGSAAVLSEGEKMMKAYIFAFALREVVGLSFPLVVDTPFGRLDEYHRGQVAEMLADLVHSDTGAQHRQAIFLMHDGEYTPYTKKHFAPTEPFEAFLANTENDKSDLGQGIDPDWFNRTAWKDWKAGKIK